MFLNITSRFLSLIETEWSICAQVKWVRTENLYFKVMYLNIRIWIYASATWFILSLLQWIWLQSKQDTLHPKNHGLWLSEQTDRGIRRNFLLKKGCGVNVKGNTKTLHWNLISYCWRSSRINITTFLTQPRKITSRIKLRMRNPRKIYIRFVINC